MCTPLRSCYYHFYLPKRETDPLSGESLHENQKRSTTTTTNITETPQMWPGAQGLFSHHTTVAVWGLLISPAENSPDLPLMHIKTGLVQSIWAAVSSQFWGRCWMFLALPDQTLTSITEFLWTIKPCSHAPYCTYNLVIRGGYPHTLKHCIHTTHGPNITHSVNEAYCVN